MITAEGRIADWDLGFLASVLKMLDSRIEALEVAADESPDPESCGICDHYEEVCGIGFVACQRYLAAVCGWYKVEKHVALARGAPVAWGLTIAQAVNHAANYWKHHDEWWTADVNQKKVKRSPLDVFGDSIGCDYPLSCILAGLTDKPRRLQRLIPEIEKWRNEIRKTA